MRVLVTGGTGFIGRNLVAELVARGHVTTTLSRRRSGLPGVAHISADAGSEEAVAAASRAEAVVHLAGLSDASASCADPYGFNRQNALGTLAILEGARRGGASVVFASSQRIYRPAPDPIPESGAIEPQDPYGYSKLCGEQWMEMYRRFHGVRTCVLRFFSVYGPGLLMPGGSSGVVGIFVGRALRGDALVAHTHQLRDLTHVSDVVSGILLALEKPAAPGSCYNIATGLGTSMEELAMAVRRATGSDCDIILEEGPSYGYLVADISRAKAELGYVPRVDVQEGLEKYVAWYRERLEVIAVSRE